MNATIPNIYAIYNIPNIDGIHNMLIVILYPFA
jgi:hypothetical protein